MEPGPGSSEASALGDAAGLVFWQELGRQVQLGTNLKPRRPTKCQSHAVPQRNVWTVFLSPLLYGSLDTYPIRLSNTHSMLSPRSSTSVKPTTNSPPSSVLASRLLGFPYSTSLPVLCLFPWLILPRLSNHQNFRVLSAQCFSLPIYPHGLDDPVQSLKLAYYLLQMLMTPKSIFLAKTTPLP